MNRILFSSVIISAMRVAGPGLTLVLVMVSTLCLVTTGYAANQTDTDLLVRQLEQTIANPKTHQAALRNGAERVSFCNYCHGKDGNGRGPEIPKMAGQNAKYLFKQFEDYGLGRRKHYVMQKLALKLTPQDRINIAIFYASLPVRTEVVNPVLARNGKVIFDSACADCHGSNGHGQDEYPRLAGQKADYVIHSLRAFGGDYSKHFDPTMRQVSPALTDDNILSVSAYIASMR